MTELPGYPVDTTDPQGRLLFGHKGTVGIMNQPTLLHLNGIFRLFRLTKGIVLNDAQITTNMQSLMNQLMIDMPKDITYKAVYDFTKIT